MGCLSSKPVREDEKKEVGAVASAAKQVKEAPQVPAVEQPAPDSRPQKEQPNGAQVDEAEDQKVAPPVKVVQPVASAASRKDAPPPEPLSEPAPNGVHRTEPGEAGISLNIAYLTQRGYYPEAPNKPNQDAFCVCPHFGPNPDDHLFGVFDGHGEHGTPCSQYCRDKLQENVLKHRLFATDVPQTLHAAFVTTNLQLHKSPVDDTMSGTTGISVFLRGRTLYAANVGDSRAVLAERRGSQLVAVDLSNDQTPFRPDECARVKACGARVLTLDQLEGLKNPNVQCWGGEDDDDGDPPRLWVPNGMYPGTAFTRSVGDTVAERIGVTAVPEVLVLELTGQHPFFLIASDGVFEFLSSQAVVDMVAKYPDPVEACKVIVAESYRLWLQYETRTDDITIIVVHVDGLA